jgi:hypothetical protein
MLDDDMAARTMLASIDEKMPRDGKQSHDAILESIHVTPCVYVQRPQRDRGSAVEACRHATAAATALDSS